MFSGVSSVLASHDHAAKRPQTTSAPRLSPEKGIAPLVARETLVRRSGRAQREHLGAVGRAHAESPPWEHIFDAVYRVCAPAVQGDPPEDLTDAVTPAPSASAA